jgi:hypothetical protein
MSSNSASERCAVETPGDRVVSKLVVTSRAQVAGWVAEQQAQ